MSRLPRFQEHLKTGFLAEAASAARFRAYAEKAEAEGMPNLARKWRDLAEQKDRLAILQLEAARQVPTGAGSAIDYALAEEQYENDVLYPKMARDVDPPTAELFSEVVAAQRGHVDSLTELERTVQASTGDIG